VYSDAVKIDEEGNTLRPIYDSKMEKKIDLIGSYVASDRVLLAQLASWGLSPESNSHSSATENTLAGQPGRSLA
jgi:hypothetical protein